MKLYVTISGTKKATGLGKTKIYQLIRSGRLHAVKVGRRTLITTKSIRGLDLRSSD